MATICKYGVVRGSAGGMKGQLHEGNAFPVGQPQFCALKRRQYDGSLGFFSSKGLISHFERVADFFPRELHNFSSLRKQMALRRISCDTTTR